MEELANLKKLLKGLNADFLPGDNIPLPQRVSDLLAIAAAWRDRESHKARFEAISSALKALRCVVLGPDVSLDPETIKALKNEIVFAPQQTYRQFRGTDVQPSFLVLESAAFIQNNIDDLQKLRGVTKFVPYHFAHIFPGDEDVIHFNHQPRKSYPDNYDISLRAQDVTYTSCSVVGTAIQIAMSMGYKQICLLGVDVGEGAEERAELEKLYAEAVRTAKANDIELINACLDTSVPHVTYADIEPFLSTQRRARAVLEAATSGELRQEWSPEEVAVAERVLLNKHPCPSDIYLPTSKYQGLERVAAIRKVVTAWNERQEIHKARLREAKRRMQGRKRCFIIGNGPSLNQTNLDLLENDVTFATNGIFLKFGDTKFRPTFYVVEDHLVGEDRYREINELQGYTKLSPYYLAYCLEDGDETIYYNHRGRKSYPHGFDFSTNAEEITYTGCTVTFSCMQLAFYMGFNEIYLIGVDMSYTIPEEVKKANEYDTEILDMEIDDPNHFVPNYFGRGYRWHDPNVDKMEQAYIEARKVTEANGVKIYNATVGGKCEVFVRVDYYSLFPGAPRRLHTLSLASAPTTAGGGGAAGLASNTVNEALASASPVTLSFALPRCDGMLLVAELEASPDDDALFRLRIEIDGKEVPHSIFAQQRPILVKIGIPAGDGDAAANLTFHLIPIRKDPSSLRVSRVSIVRETSFVKAPFPLSHFDGTQYLEENPDVARAVMEREVLSALSHYELVGKKADKRFPLAVTRRPNRGYRFEIAGGRPAASRQA